MIRNTVPQPGKRCWNTSISESGVAEKLLLKVGTQRYEVMKVPGGVAEKVSRIKMITMEE